MIPPFVFDVPSTAFYNNSVSFLDVIGQGYLAIFGANALLAGLFLLIFFGSLLALFNASAAVFLVIGFGLILTLTSSGGLLPDYISFLLLLSLGGLVALAIMHLLRPR